MVKVRVGPGAYFGIRMTTGEATEELKRLQDRLAHQRPFYTKVGNIFRAAMRRNFAAGGNPAWTPLAPSTLAEKAASGFPDPNARTKTGRIAKRLMQNGGFGPGNILIRTGRMRDAIAQRGAPGNVSDIKDDGAYFGINPDVVPYAAVHEYGGQGEYDILPKAGKRLAFMGADGYVVLPVGRGVRHPPLPQRRMTTMTDEDIVRIEQAAVDHISGALRSASDE